MKLRAMALTTMIMVMKMTSMGGILCLVMQHLMMTLVQVRGHPDMELTLPELSRPREITRLALLESTGKPH